MPTTNHTVTWTTIRTNHSLQWHTVIHASIQTDFLLLSYLDCYFRNATLCLVCNWQLSSRLRFSGVWRFSSSKSVKHQWNTTTSNQLFNNILSDLTLPVTDKNKCVEQVTRKIKWKEISRGVELRSLFPRPHPLSLHIERVF